MSRFPVDLQRETLDVVTGGAGVITVRTIVAAPGAGKRLRLWSYSMNPNAVATAPGNWRGDCRTAAGAVYAGAAGQGFGRDGETVGGGIAFPANTAMSVLDVSSVAGLAVSHLVRYTLEEAT